MNRRFAAGDLLWWDRLGSNFTLFAFVLGLAILGTGLKGDDLSGTEGSGPPQPLHHWAFDTLDNGKSPDTGSSNSLIDATVLNATLDTGKFGKALNLTADGTVTVNVNGTERKFSGNAHNRAEIPLDLADLADRGFTICVWVQIANQPQGYGTIVTSGRNAGLELRAAGDHLSLSVNHDWNALTSAKGLFTDGSQWTHIAVVYTEDKASLYVDGALVGTHPTVQVQHFWPILYVGGYDVGKFEKSSQENEPGVFQQGLVGKIDDLCIYDHALNDAEIAQLAKATKP